MAPAPPRFAPRAADRVARRAALAAALVVGLGGCAHAPPAPASGNAAYPMDLTLTSADGGQVSLSDYAGQVVVVNFFATWCMPCLAEMPYLDALKQKVPGVQVVGIAMDQNARKVLPLFRQQFHLGYPILLADDDVFQGRTVYGRIPAIPATFLLDQKGRLVLAVAGALDPPTFTPLLKKVVAGEVHGAAPGRGTGGLGPGGIGEAPPAGKGGALAPPAPAG